MNETDVLLCVHSNRLHFRRVVLWLALHSPRALSPTTALKHQQNRFVHKGIRCPEVMSYLQLPIRFSVGVATPLAKANRLQETAQSPQQQQLALHNIICSVKNSWVNI
jgi:hypothetical protein